MSSVEKPFRIDNGIPDRQEVVGLLDNPEGRGVTERYLQTHPEVIMALGSTAWGSDRFFYRKNTTPETTSTVILPFDVDDDQLRASETLRQLNAPSKRERFEAQLWVNAELPTPTDGGKVADDYDKYERLVGHLQSVRKRLFPNVLLRTRFKHTEGRTMNRVWGRALGLTIGESILLNRPSNYPVMRFDPDSKYAQKDVVPAMAEAIRNNEAHLIKVPTSFSSRYGFARNRTRYGLDLMSPAERHAHNVTEIYALTKDIIESQLEATEERVYHDESGSGAQLINWMRVLTIARENDPEQLSDDGENKIFLAIARTALSKEVSAVRYIDSGEVKHYTSARRFRKLATTLQPPLIPLSVQGPTYKNYMHMKQEEEIAIPEARTVQDIMTMIGVMLLCQEEVCGRTITLPRKERSKLISAIERGRFRHNGNPISSYFDWVSESRQLASRYLKEVRDNNSSGHLTS